MSAAHDREQQNNARLSTLATTVSALRATTLSIHDHARDQTALDDGADTFSTMAGALTGSAGRLGRMARQGNRVAVLKLAGAVIGVVVVVWWGVGWAVQRAGAGRKG